MSACTDSPPPPPERPDASPFACASPTTTTTYRVDSITLPTDATTANNDGFDLYGTGELDNQLGAVMAAFVDNIAPVYYAPNTVANAAFTGGVDWEIVTETCPDTGEVRVRLGSFGGSTPRAVGTRSGSAITATAGCAEVPVGSIVGNTDTGWTLAEDMAVSLTVGDGEMSGRFGVALDPTAIPELVAVPLAPAATLEEAATGGDSGTVGYILDTNQDGVITVDEILSWPLLTALLATDSPPDAQPAGEPHCTTASAWLSLAAQIHAIAQ